MKKHLILAAMAMTALFTACNNDETENITVDNNTVSFVIGGVDSRAITSYDTSNGYKTVFEQDDAIGIYSSGLANTQMENVEYTVGNDNKLTTTDNTEYEYTGTSEATFHAYFPHQETATSFTINTDQSSADNFHDNDFMTATTTASSGAVTLNFNHKLVLVEVNLNGFEEGTIISGVKLNSVKPTIAYTPATATLGEVSGDAGSIIMFPQTGNERYWAIIPAQTIAAGALFTVTTSDGDAYSYTTSGNTTFETGKLVRYNLTVGTETIKSLVEMGIPTIVEWGANNSVVEESGNIIYDKLNIIANINENMTFNQITSRANLPEVESWGVYYNTVEGKEKTSAEYNNGAIKFTGHTTKSSWYNNTLYYYAGANNILKPGKTYKAIIKGYTDNNTTGKVQINLCQKAQEDLFTETDNSTKTDDIHYATASGTNNTINYWDLTANESTKEIKFYPGTVAETSGSNPITTQKETNGDIIIAISPINYDSSNNYNNIFYITSITIQEVDN